MNDVPENELLSAYLDGELTAEEQAQVERLLAADPEARQLVDELRALSASVKALPRHPIGRDVSEEVISRARRRMPTPAPARSPEHVPSEDEDQVPVWRAIVRRVTRPRNFLWSAVAVAVVVLLMLMEPHALNEPHAPSVAVKSAADADERSATPTPAPSIQAREEAVEVLAAEEAAPRLAAEPSSPPSMGAAGDEYRGRAAGMGGRAGVVDDRGKDGAPRLAKRDAHKGQPSRAGIAARASESGAAVESAPAKGARRAHRARHEPGLLMVVSCDVTRSAQQRDVFQELLARFRVSDAVTRVVSGRDAPGRGSPAETAAPESDRLAMRRRPERRAVEGGPFQVVEVDVEATADQIKALLAELHDRPGQFASLSYTLLPSAVTRGLGRVTVNGQIAGQRHVGEALQEEIQTVGKPAGPASGQQKLSRAEVDKLLDSAWQFQYSRRLREEAQPGTTLEAVAQPAPTSPQREGRARTAASQPATDQGQRRGEPKLQASLVTPGAGPQPDRPQSKRGRAREPFEDEREPAKGMPEADRFEKTSPPRKLDARQATQPELREAAEAEVMFQQEPAQAQSPTLPEEDAPLDRDPGRCRVRFVLRMVEPTSGNAAASVAKDAPAEDAPMADVADEAAARATEASPARKDARQAPESGAAGAKP